MLDVRRRAFVRDVAVCVAVVVALYALMRVPFQPLQIPGYLLVVGFDWLEFALGSTGERYPFWFGAYLLGLGVVGGLVARLFRTLTVRTERSGWRFGAAGACVVVGLGALAFTLFVSVHAGITSVLITGGTALALFAAAGLLLRIGA
ncbi:hypothetical protein NDI76_11650 [Halogeometricum sp. S1BR25-6]|uniref:Uncharacterized protein n=1 Tax=Halogeometricum salsisoli TaxID=2950536 RepID=A0ABU2GF09_9EURY|nr:hypothetical protein [Halogeometricum sp. S1BR25-6]MDS0299396.1 hypothetical protein [Halogeometricum sp. S1BR25-6]